MSSLTAAQYDEYCAWREGYVGGAVVPCADGSTLSDFSHDACVRTPYPSSCAVTLGDAVDCTVGTQEVCMLGLAGPPAACASARTCGAPR